MDDRITQLQEQADQLSRTLDETAGRLAGEIARLRAQAEEIARAQADAGRLREENDTLLAENASLKTDRDRFAAEGEQLRAAYAPLRDLVVRYAVACAAVDLQTALLKRDSAQGQEGLSDLQQAMTEEKNASDALRQLARKIQNDTRAR